MLQENGVKPELAVYQDGDIDRAKRWVVDTGICQKPSCWDLLPSYSIGGTPMLDEFAMAGGAENPEGPHSYFEISATGEAPELIDALSDLGRRQVLYSCDIAIPREVAARALALNSTLVAIDCQEIPLQSPSGGRNWDYGFDSGGVPIAITLLGEVCDRLQWEGVDRIDVFFVCTHPLL